MYPYPDELHEYTPEDECPPISKHLTKNTTLENLYRWGIPGRSTGNHRIIYAIHNYHKVVLPHYFDKRYNGSIRKADIIPAETNYIEYCTKDPFLY